MYIFVYMYGLPKSLEKKWRAFILPSWAIAEGPGTRPWVTPQVVVPDIYMYILRIHKHLQNPTRHKNDVRDICSEMTYATFWESSLPKIPYARPGAVI